MFRINQINDYTETKENFIEKMIGENKWWLDAMIGSILRSTGYGHVGQETDLC